jgi:two-component system nitrate/nitrite response regulator NarL
MPGINGIDSVTKCVKLAVPGKVVIFSAFASSDFVHRAIELGARGFITKNVPIKALISILHLIASGQIFVPFNTMMLEAGSPATHLLSVRERSVLDYVADGKVNKEIANNLNVSEATIKLIMRSVCKKLACKNRTQAAMVYKTVLQA